jgi:hypothetical protein
MILLDLRMHRTGVDDRVRLKGRMIALQRHAAPETTARRVALHAFAHGTEIFLSWLTRLRGQAIYDLIVIKLATTGMWGRLTFSASFHPLTVRCST